MGDAADKKRNKPKPAVEVVEADPPRRRRPKKTQEDVEEAPVNGKSDKKSKRSRKEKQETGKTEEPEETVIDMGGVAASGSKPKKSKEERKKSHKRKPSVSSSSSLDEEDMESDEESQLKKSKPKVRNLAQSRRWDQEDLEVIVPDEEVSDEGPEEGEGGVTSQPTMEIVQVLAMEDEEKAQLDYLTRVMPDEVLRRIYSHLEPPVIDSTATVCHRLNNLLQERSVWKVYQPEWDYVTKERFNKAHSRNAYAALYNHEMRERENTRRRIEAAEYAEHLSAQSEWAKGFMVMFLFNRSMDYLSVLAFILGTCFAAARSQEAILWNWRLVLIPFYIPMLQLWLTPLIYDICRAHYTSTNIDEVTDSRIATWHISFVKFRPYRPLIYLTNLALLIFWILLMIKLNDKLNGIPAGVTIIPWLLLLLCIVLEQMFGWASGTSWSHGRWVDRLYITIACIITAATLLLVVFKLDGVVKSNWVVVLIPLWILFGFMFLFPWLALFCASCSYSIRTNIRITDAEGVSTGFGVHVMCTIFLMAPIFTWLLLIALNLDGSSHRSWPVIFIPIFIIEGLLLLGCGFIDFIAWCDP